MRWLYEWLCDVKAIMLIPIDDGGGERQMSSSESYVRHFGLWLILIVLPALAISGCDKVPTFQELTGNEQPSEPSPAPPVEPALPPQRPEPVAKAPAPKTPEQIYEEFLGIAQGLKKDEHLAQLAQFEPGLREQIVQLDMSGSQMSDRGTTYLKAFPNLEELKIDATGVTAAGLPEIGKLQNLKHLSMAGARVNESGMDGIKELSNLEYLNISHTAASDLSFQYLLDMKKLETLIITDMQHLQGQGLAELGRLGVLSNIRELHASNSPIGNYGLKALQKMPHLEILVLNNAAVNDVHMPIIGSRKELIRLSLERNSIGSDSLKHLSKLKNLEYLSLAGINTVQDEAFNHIKNLKSLKFLNVSGTGVSSKAASILQERFLPDTKISYDNR